MRRMRDSFLRREFEHGHVTQTDIFKSKTFKSLTTHDHILGIPMAQIQPFALPFKNASAAQAPSSHGTREEPA